MAIALQSFNIQYSLSEKFCVLNGEMNPVSQMPDIILLDHKGTNKPFLSVY